MEDGKSKAAVRREKFKVSELVKKLRIIYNKLLIKKDKTGTVAEGE